MQGNGSQSKAKRNRKPICGVALLGMPIHHTPLLSAFWVWLAFTFRHYVLAAPRDRGSILRGTVVSPL